MRRVPHCRFGATLAGAALALGACTSPVAPPASVPEPKIAPAPVPLVPALTLEAYKKSFARRVAARSADTFSEPLPEMLKSIVVLDITIDRHGNLARVAIRRSNGYRALEERALSNVRHAAPYDAPAFTLRRQDGTVNFLETFLFRDDGRFQIRSLVAER